MEISLGHGPGSSAATCQLAPGETITSEGGAMLAMSGDMQITTTTHKRGGGGIMKAMKRMLTGESFFVNHFTAGRSGGTVMLAATLPGDMVMRELNGNRLIVQSGSWVGSGEGVDIEFGWQGFKSALFSGESMFWLHLSGHGPLILSSFGAIYPVQVNGAYIVDTGHIVAFDDSLKFTVTKAGGSWATAILGGEGLVCRFEGHGTVWCQSHNPGGFGGLLGSMLKPR